MNKTNAKYTTGYGAKIRKQHAYYQVLSKKAYVCSSCGRLTLKRVRSGLWSCTSCLLEIAGNAYYPSLST